MAVDRDTGRGTCTTTERARGDPTGSEGSSLSIHDARQNPTQPAGKTGGIGGANQKRSLITSLAGVEEILLLADVVLAALQKRMPPAVASQSLVASSDASARGNTRPVRPRPAAQASAASRSSKKLLLGHHSS